MVTMHTLEIDPVNQSKIMIANRKPYIEYTCASGRSIEVKSMCMTESIQPQVGRPALQAPTDLQVLI